ncbi:hypothetical protein T492DRAFT_883414, partial [Pavlovales sp. CCMP2436]
MSSEADVRIAKEEKPANALACVGLEDVPVVVRGEAMEGCFNAAWLQSQGGGDATAGPLACECPAAFLQLSGQVIPEAIGWGPGGLLAADGSDALSHLPEDQRPAPCLIACDVGKKASAVVPVHAGVRCALLLPFSADSSKVKGVDWIVVRGADRAAAEKFWAELGAVDAEGVPQFLKFEQIYENQPPFPLFLATQKAGDVLVLPPHALALCSAKLYALVCWERLPISLLHRAIPAEMPPPPRTHLGAPALRAGGRSCLAAFCALRDLVAPQLRRPGEASLSGSARFDLKQLVAAIERAQRAELRHGVLDEERVEKARLADPAVCACESCGRELFLFAFKEGGSGAFSCPYCAEAAHGAEALAAPSATAVVMRTAPVRALPRLLSGAAEVLAKASADAAAQEAADIEAIQQMQTAQDGEGVGDEVYDPAAAAEAGAMALDEMSYEPSYETSAARADPRAAAAPDPRAAAAADPRGGGDPRAMGGMGAGQVG